MTAREKDFKIGSFHGKLSPEDLSSEAKLRNDLYLIGMLWINIARTKNVKIRLIGYEIPLGRKGDRLDLLGYDEDHNPYLIELKKDSTNEDLNQVIEQIRRYERQFSDLKRGIRDEFREKFHWPEFEFTDEVKKMILAHREFYKGKSRKDYKSTDIYICSFARLKDICGADGNVIILDKRGSKGYVNLKIENR
jgi:hypothetical protein